MTDKLVQALDTQSDYFILINVVLFGWLVAYIQLDPTPRCLKARHHTVPTVSTQFLFTFQAIMKDHLM